MTQTERDMSAPPYDLLPASGGMGPFLCSSPHSGRYYPVAFKRASQLDGTMLRRSEDCYVDELFAHAPSYGVPLLKAVYPRAYVDLNRLETELDPLLIRDPLPPYATSESERVMAGLGTIARVVAVGVPIYSCPLSLDEVMARIAHIYRPYHQALNHLLTKAQAHFGWCALIDCHSMPSHIVRTTVDMPDKSWDADIVLGDRFGTSCDQRLTDRAEELLTRLGYKVVRNTPYAGGHCTRHYGAPENGRHALQVEINRALYMNEQSLEKTAGFSTLRRDMGRLIKGLSQLDLSTDQQLAAE
ncbi:N-formylglutamate amidohydrolase [Iodidimonas muriae]|uniref:N-formylglutamate amidohydrolase n=1 Tax=Iodidimonas muriae TaxID=261467 RepID=A0ABQ2LCZ3_9PROT|nr:N-formylglutamate amidohydrolase [Iodidimonas muriae]GGO11540.1 N-formylglutamate amidohydrolase [Iodidimonas muriae]